MLHQHDEVPLVQDLGLAVAPGVHALMAVDVTKVSRDCYFINFAHLSSYDN